MTWKREYMNRMSGGDELGKQLTKCKDNESSRKTRGISVGIFLQ